jgi:sugar lactone lactonase YvrE
MFSAHGLNVRPGSGGRHTLYMVHHGFRESIEVFELDAKPTTPTVTWVGCIVAPETASLNGVAPLPDGGLVATSNYPRGDADARVRAQAGMNTGEIWEWHAGRGWHIVAGSEAPGPNGIEVSQDGTWLYVNMWPVRKFMRLSRGLTPVKKDVIDLPFHPDNIRWQTDGSLLSAGHYAPTAKRASECLRTMCADASAKVARIDPQTLKFREVVNYPSNAVFFGATAALQVGKEIWIGAVRGDRIARYPVD